MKLSDAMKEYGHNRELVLRYTRQVEYRVTVRPDSMGVSDAIHDAMRGSGLNTSPHVIPESITFTIE